VSELTLRSTLRDLRAHLLRPSAAILMAGVALILGLSGPFDTWTTHSLPVRFLYWTSVVWLTYSAGFIVTGLTAPRLRQSHVVIRTVAVGLAVAVAVFLVLLLLNAGFGEVPDTPLTAFRSFGVVLVICLVIETAGEVLGFRQLSQVDLEQQPTPDGPALLLRLPLQKRGALLSLSAQDHYVDVVTSKGQEMLLLRLKDAIRETAPVRGLQVHRSHWVALAAVSAAERRGDGAILTLTNGQTLPVSRAFMPALREAAILPGKAS
jgi:hypothetical protein